MGLSASVIGGILGTPRNAVLGKTFRIGLSRKEQNSQEILEPRATRKPPPRLTSPEDLLTIAANRSAAARKNTCSSEGRPIRPPLARPDTSWHPGSIATPDIGVGDPAIMHLRRNSCRFPIGDPKRDDFRFCCRTAAPNHPYCTGHAAIVYVPKQQHKVSSQEARS
jgi:GcrA cell cycle regulator